MAEATCRSCGGTIDAGGTTCPHCGVPDPVSASTATGPRPGRSVSTPDSADQSLGPPAAAPVPERDTAGSRLRSVGKAIGCLVLALLVLGIAIVVGVFDVFF